ncbi:MAG: cytochrome c-type biogenesis protein [Natronospirillum sp.]
MTYQQWIALSLCALVFLMSAPVMAQIDTNTGAMIQDGPSMVEPLRQFSSPEHERRYYGLTWELRCPQCDNQAIGDSNAPVSADMRQRVAAMIEAGHTDREIVDFMIERWGEGVTFRPRFGAHTAWIWAVGAFLVVFLLAIIIGIRLRYAGTSDVGAGLTAEERARLLELRHSGREEDS